MLFLTKMSTETRQAGHKLQAIDDFLAHKRIAFVGLSTNPADFSQAVKKELEQHQFDVVGVNPKHPEGTGWASTIEEISPPVEGAFIMTPKSATRDVVEQCVRAGIKRVWLHHGVGAGSVTPEAVDLAQQRGLSVVAGECPLMFLEHADKAHRAHASLKKLAGTYPDQSSGLATAAMFAYGFVGWALCGMVMYLGLAFFSETVALVLHALLVPVIFGRLTLRYLKYREAPKPLALALVFTLTVIFLDAVLVAPVFEGSYAMFGSLLGTWIPFALIFFTTWRIATRRAVTEKALR